MADLMNRFGHNVRKEELEEIVNVLLITKKIKQNGDGKFIYIGPQRS